MANDVTRYSTEVFFKGALPLMKYIAADDASLRAKFKGVNAVYQVSAMDGNEKKAIHFIVTNGTWEAIQGVYDGKIDGGLAFSSCEKFVAFMKGDMTKLPKFIIGNPGKFVKFMLVLLKMSSLLTAKEAPADNDTCVLICKCYFYLLTVGISSLNKMGEPLMANWIAKSPDRVYQMEVATNPEITAHLRFAHGKSKACKGACTRCEPFFTMRFATPQDALAILLGTGDMFNMTASGQLQLVGGPEFGVQLSELLFKIAEYAQ